MRHSLYPSSCQERISFTLTVSDDTSHQAREPSATRMLWAYAQRLIDDGRRVAEELRVAVGKIEVSISSAPRQGEGISGAITFFGSDCAELAELQAELRRRGHIPHFMTAVATGK